MKVGLIASPWIPVPPPAYGGTETVLDNLCRGLAELGHEVHLATVGDSTCPVARTWCYDEGPSPIGDPISETVHVRAAYRELAGRVDVLHDHTLLGPSFLADSVPAGVPVLTTQHGPFTPSARMMHAARPERVALVAISHAQRASALGVRVDAVIHHGIDLAEHRPGPGDGGHAMFVGRMTAEKGPDRAILAARRAGLPLVLAAKMREPDEIRYFTERVRPLLGSDVELLGEADVAGRVEALRRARVLVNPIRWPEPFGLVMVEALACGTPVVALRHGAAPEIVDDGVTGFLRDDEDGLVEALGRVGELDRADCRAAAELRFSRSRMAADHVALYERLLSAVPVPAGPPRISIPAESPLSVAPSAVTSSRTRSGPTRSPSTLNGSQPAGSAGSS
jgi:glycosyltransferase involved in cell wall biosynthesis